jgi:hypothetical protein
LYTGKAEKGKKRPFALLSWKISVYNLDWKIDVSKIGLMKTDFMVRALVLIIAGAYGRIYVV